MALDLADPSEPRKIAAAASAPSSCATQWAPVRGQGKWRLSANAKLKAGLKCAPEMCPTA
jgi:hypothetical protein